MLATLNDKYPVRDGCRSTACGRAAHHSKSRSWRIYGRAFMSRKCRKGMIEDKTTGSKAESMSYHYIIVQVQASISL